MQRKGTFGYIYVIRLLDSQYLFTTKSRKGCSFKIGKSRTPDIRTKTLGVLMPYDTEIITIFPAMDMSWAERYIHEKLAHQHTNGEWFALTRPMFEWLITLGSLGFSDLWEDNRAEHDSNFKFYTERLHYNPE